LSGGAGAFGALKNPPIRIPFVSSG